MNRLKSACLATYYQVSAPWRFQRLRNLARRGQAPALVLFYHRVADMDPNDWTISCRTFCSQLDWITRHFRWGSLEQIVAGLQAGKLAEPMVHITFDDGYADNMQYALPLLAQRKIPFTYFVSTQHVFEQRPFPHDLLCGRPLAPNRPEDLPQIVRWGGEVGAHSQSHADLGKLHCADALSREIVGSRDRLQDFLQRPVRYFAFPYGQFANLSPLAFQIARQAGFEAVCSAYGGYNFPGDDPFHLQRIHGDVCSWRLKNWLTLDPRKLALTERYRYCPDSGESARAEWSEQIVDDCDLVASESGER